MHEVMPTQKAPRPRSKLKRLYDAPKPDVNKTLVHRLQEAQLENSFLGDDLFNYIQERGQNATDQCNPTVPFTIDLLTQASPADPLSNAFLPASREMPQSQQNFESLLKHCSSSESADCHSMDCQNKSDSEGGDIILSQWHAQQLSEEEILDAKTLEEEGIFADPGKASSDLTKDEQRIQPPRGEPSSRCSKEPADRGPHFLGFQCDVSGSDIGSSLLNEEKSTGGNLNPKPSPLDTNTTSIPLAQGGAMSIPESEHVDSAHPAPPLDNLGKPIMAGSDVGTMMGDCLNGRPSAVSVTINRDKENDQGNVQRDPEQPCVICGLDLAGMSLEGKTQHVNRCCDHVEGLFGGKLTDVPEAIVSVEAFLRELKLSKYLGLFTACRCDIDSLFELTDARLVQMGLPLGPRKKILIGATVLKSSGIRSHKAVSEKKRKRQSKLNVSSIRKKFRRFKGAPESEKDSGNGQEQGNALQVLMENAKQGVDPTPVLTQVNFREIELRSVGELYEIMETEYTGPKGLPIQKFIDVRGAPQPPPTDPSAPLFHLHASNLPISCPLRVPLDATKQTKPSPKTGGQSGGHKVSAKSHPSNDPKRDGLEGSKPKHGKEPLGVKLVKLQALKEELRLLEQSVCSIKSSIRCVEEEIEQERALVCDPG